LWLRRRLARGAYLSLEREIGACGTFTIANASIAVPFVGAAAGTLTIAQVMRLASMQSGGALIQMELAAPEMVSAAQIRTATASRNMEEEGSKSMAHGAKTSAIFLPMWDRARPG